MSSLGQDVEDDPDDFEVSRVPAGTMLSAGSAGGVSLKFKADISQKAIAAQGQAANDRPKN